MIPKKGRFYCFVCKESGDVLLSHETLRDGLSHCGARGSRPDGDRDPRTDQPKRPDPREPLFSAAAVAHDWFARQLREAPEAEEARAYLGTRGLDLDAVGPVRSWVTLLGERVPGRDGPRLGLKEAVLLEAGLLAQRDDGIGCPGGSVGVSRFDPLILRAASWDLRTIAGTGEPKYLNSPETPIFKKGTMCTTSTTRGRRSAKRKASSWSKDISMCCDWSWPAARTW